MDPEKKYMPEDNGHPMVATSDEKLPPKDPLASGERTTFPMTKFQILRNLFVVSFAFMFMFTAFQSLTNLQSTLNREEGVGTGGLAILYGALVISCLFVPPFVIGHLGCKWTIAASMVCYIVYMAANFYAIWGLMAPASVIIGLGAAPLWSAKCTYLTQMSVWYAKMTGATEDDIINRFFGFFFMFFQTSQIWGNLISSTVFAAEEKNQTLTYEELHDQCGANFDPLNQAAENNTNLDKPVPVKVYTVCGIYTGCAVLAFLIVVFALDTIKLDKKTTKKEGKLSFHLTVETFKHWLRSDYQKLLMVLTFYSGIEQAFIGADFTKSFVGCALGIWNIGYVMICYGVVDALSSFAFGRMVQYVGHIPFFVLAFLLHGGVQITFLFWVPDPDSVYLFYILAALWGMGDAVIQTQINAYYGYLFTDNTEAAFSNYRLWESCGFILGFAWGNFVKTSIKLYFTLSVLIVGMFLYAVTEFMERSRRKNEFALDK
ncbi:hypothetical protein FSP39_004334 [Pinctada imbricata]|uniref:Uncharacterized protein n=1 Tax=Pinctada imbricata TaxID=66713 RepID=A0AA88XHY6_PINIB|nr:hypothetical protein FSP39_004334 [Pinctada imbricata]